MALGFALCLQAPAPHRSCLLLFQMWLLASFSLALFPVTDLPGVQKQALHRSPPLPAQPTLLFAFALAMSNSQSFQRGPASSLCFCLLLLDA